MHLIGIHLTGVSRGHASHRDASRRREYNCCWVRRISIFEIWEKTPFLSLYPTVPLSGCCGSSYRGWLASALHLPTGSKTRTATSSSLRIPEHVTRFKQQLLTRPPSQILCSATRHIVMALD